MWIWNRPQLKSNSLSFISLIRTKQTKRSHSGKVNDLLKLKLPDETNWCTAQLSAGSLRLWEHRWSSVCLRRSWSSLLFAAVRPLSGTPTPTHVPTTVSSTTIPKVFTATCLALHTHTPIKPQWNYKWGDLKKILLMVIFVFPTAYAQALHSAMFSLDLQ